MAHEVRGVEPESIGYIEAHGTGTPLGDPIELAGLTPGLSSANDRKQFCTIGTAKTNVGHLDVAAGVTGLINAAHIVRRWHVSADASFQAAESKFRFREQPVPGLGKRTEWHSERPRRAGVSSFGVGGTNAHVVLRASPRGADFSPSTRTSHLLVLSARSPAALDRATEIWPRI